MDPQLDRLYQHLEWANDQLMEQLGQIPQPPGEALRLLSHLVRSEQVWLARIQHQSVTGASPWPDLTLDQCRAATRSSLAGFREVLRHATPDRLTVPVPYTTFAGQAWRTPLVDILLHVALHGAHHRGQIAGRIRLAGLEPADTGYIAFVRAQAAAVPIPRVEAADPAGEPGPMGI